MRHAGAFPYFRRQDIRHQERKERQETAICLPCVAGGAAGACRNLETAIHKKRRMTMAMTAARTARTAHQDFGEKIGGARKDLWRDRGLSEGDLDSMNGREAEKFVKKDNIWKKPDYEAMVAGGIPRDVAYYVKLMRDSANPSPDYGFTKTDDGVRRREKAALYISTIRAMKETAESLRTQSDCLGAYKAFLGRAGLQPADAAKNPALSGKGLRQIRIEDPFSFLWLVTKEAERKQFGAPKDGKLPAGYSVRQNTSSYKGAPAGSWFAAKGHVIIADGLPSKEDAVKAAQEHASARRKSSKKRLVPPQLAHVERTGPDVRGGRDVSGDDYIEAFGFRGGEYGNWMSQEDRQASLNMGYESLKDLASVLGIEDGAVSLNGTLAIAFGARGNGNAAAHYEPLRKVINLTKMNGAGSLAHEWFHGLDDFLGEAEGAGGLLSESGKGSPEFKNLIDTMKYRAETEAEAKERTAADLARMRDAASWSIDREALDAIKASGKEDVFRQAEEAKERLLSGAEGSAERLCALKLEADGIPVGGRGRERLKMHEDMIAVTAGSASAPKRRIKTAYFKNSIRMDDECKKEGGYWQSPSEMAARAFACYVMDRLQYRSDYLDGHAESAVTAVIERDGSTGVLRAYPEGAEREAINEAFDRLFGALKEEGILKEAAPAAPAAM